MIWLTRVTRVLAAGVVALLLALPAGTASASVTSPAAGSPRIAMILLDVSRALSNVETQDAREAALRYASALPSDVEVGLVKFSEQWQEMLPPTANRAELAGALNASHRSGQTATAIYDALTAAEAAVRAAGAAPPRPIPPRWRAPSLRPRTPRPRVRPARRARHRASHRGWYCCSRAYS